MLIHAAHRIHLWLLPVILPMNVFATGATEAAGARPAQSPVLASETLNSGYLVQLIVGLLFVLLCIIALAWLARRMNRFQSSSDGALQILGGISMGARERVVLVQVGSTQLLLGVAPEGVLFVGDDRRDVQCAHTVGAMSVAAGWGYIHADDSPATWGADWTLDSPSDLTGIWR